MPSKGILGMAAICAAYVTASTSPGFAQQGGSPAEISFSRAMTQVAQAAFTGGTIAAIRVEGTQRIDPATVRSYLQVMQGDPFDPERIDASLRALFATGLFADVTIRRVDSTLVVVVTENPIINRIAFEGNERIEDTELQAEVQLRPRVVFTRTRVQSDVERILELYRRTGRFGTTVEPKLIQLDQNRVDLVFEINESPVTGVNRINIIGNEAFSDSTLRQEILTRESAWWRFLTASDNYDPDRLTLDRELLRRFYLSEGYADFRVQSAVAELAPDRSGFFITFTIEEGQRYNFGEVRVDTTITDLNADVLTQSLTTKTGAIYNATEVERTINNLQAALADLQYAFAEVRPSIRRNPETLTVDVTYQVTEGPRVFVERINIVGNVRTLDRVIRREFDLAEGDPFSQTRLRQSEQRVRDLGFFERVEVRRQEGTQPDQTVLDVEVAERATGEVSFGLGFSSADGPLADLGIRERNLLGRGQDLRFGVTLSGRGTQADVSFTEPFFLERDLAAGVDIFRRTRDNRDESSFDEEDIGFSLRLGYPLSERLRQRVFYTLNRTTIDDIDPEASRFIREQEGTRLLSLVGQELTYDRRNSRLEPTAGYVLRLATDVAGLGGDSRFLRGRLSGATFFALADEWVVGLSAEVGQIVGIGDDVRISDRFFLGGETLRGFEPRGVGPRSRDGEEDSLGGNILYRSSVELTFPLGLPNELGLRGRLFTDVGAVTTLDSVDDEEVDDSALPRVAVGVGLSFASPFGPIRLDVAQPLVKEDFDQTEIFRFSFGTRF